MTSILRKTILLIFLISPNIAIDKDKDSSLFIDETLSQTATSFSQKFNHIVLFDKTDQKEDTPNRSSHVRSRKLQTSFFSYADYFLYQNDAYLASMGKSLSMSTGILTYGTAGAGEATTSWNDMTSYGIEGEWIPDIDSGTLMPYRSGVSVSAGNYSVAYGAGTIVVIQQLPFPFISSSTWSDTAKFGTSVLLPTISDIGGSWTYRDALDTDLRNGGTVPGATLSTLLARRWGNASSFGNCTFPSGPFLRRNNVTFTNRTYTITNLALCGRNRLFVRGLFSNDGGSFVSALSLENTSGPGALSGAMLCLRGPAASGCFPDSSSYVATNGTYSRAWTRIQLWYSQSSNFGIGLACSGTRVAISSPDTNVVTVFAEAKSLIDIGPGVKTTFDTVETLSASTGHPFFGLDITVPVWSLNERPSWLAISRVSATSSSVEDLSELSSILGGSIDEGGFCFGQSLVLTQTHLVVGSPGASTFKPWNSRPEYINFGSGNQIGAVYVFELSSAAFASEAVVSSMRGINGGGPDAFKYIRTQPTIDLLATARRGIGLSTASTYAITCRATSAITGSRFGSSLTADVSPNGEHLAIWSGAPNSNRVITISVGTVSRSCSLSTSLFGFRITTEVDIGTAVTLNDEMGYFGSPSADNSLINQFAVRGRLYVKAWCFPNRFINSAISTSYSRRCSSCAVGFFSRGEDVSMCFSCPSTKPANSVWILGAGCVWTCSPGFFGPNCLPCSTLMGTKTNPSTYALSLAASFLLPANAQWVDDSSVYSASNIQTCAWSCDFSYSINASLTGLVPGYTTYGQFLRLSSNASTATITSIVSSVCIPPPPPAKLLPLLVLGLESDLWARSGDFRQNNITSSTVDIVLSVPASEYSYCLGFRAILQWYHWTGASGVLEVDVPLKGSPDSESGLIISSPTSATFNRISAAAKLEYIDYIASSYIVVTVRLRRLLGNCSYTVQMAAYNPGGIGPFSSYAPNQSLQGESFFFTKHVTQASAPSTPVATIIGSSFFTASWTSPFDLGGASLVGFEVCLCTPTCNIASPSTNFQTPCNIIVRRGLVNSSIKNFTLISNPDLTRIDDGTIYSSSDTEFRAAFSRSLAKLINPADNIVQRDAIGYFGQSIPFDIVLNSEFANSTLFQIAANSTRDMGPAIQIWLQRVYGLNWPETSLILQKDTPLSGFPDNRTSIQIPYLFAGSSYSSSVQIFTSPLTSSNERVILSSPPSDGSLRLTTSAVIAPSSILPVFWVSSGNVSSEGKVTITLNSGIYCAAVPNSGSSVSLLWRAPIESGGYPTNNYRVTIAAYNTQIETLFNESASAFLRGEYKVGQSIDPFTAGVPSTVTFTDLSSVMSPWRVSPARVTGLLANTRYVAAVNQQGGLRSDWAGIQLADCTTGPAVPPSSPISVTAALSSSNSILTVMWSPPNDNGGIRQVSYSLLVTLYVPPNLSSRIQGVGSNSTSSSSFPVALFRTNSSFSSSSFSLLRIAAGSTFCFYAISETSAGSSPSNFISDPTRSESIFWKWPLNATSSIQVSLNASNVNSTKTCITVPSQMSFTPSVPLEAPVQYSMLSSSLVIPPISSESLLLLTDAMSSIRLSNMSSENVDTTLILQLASVPWSRIFHRKLIDSISLSRADVVEFLQLLSPSSVTCIEGRGVNLQNLTLATSSTTSFSIGGGLLLSWLPPAILGGYPVIDYVVEQSLDNWQTFSQSQSLILVAPTDADGTDFSMPWTYAAQSAELVHLFGATSYDEKRTQLQASSLSGPLQSISRNLTSTCFANSSIVENVVAYISALPSNSAVSFRVAAVTIAGRGAMSSASSLFFTGNSTLPSRPGALKVLAVTSSTVTLEWQAPLALGGVTLSQMRYTVYAKVLSSVNNVDGCSSSVANWTRAYTTTNSQTTLVVSGLAADVSYEFMVSAISSIGLGPTTSPVNATTLSSAVPLAPHYTSISILSSHSGSLRVSFLPSPVDGGAPLLGYRVYAALNSTVASLSWNSNAVLWSLVGEVSSPFINSSVQNSCGLSRLSTATDLFAAMAAVDATPLPSLVARLTSASVVAASASFNLISTNNVYIRTFIGPLYRLSEYVVCISAYNRIGEGPKSAIIWPISSSFASSIGVTTAGSAPTFVSTLTLATESSIRAFFSPQDSVRALTSLSAFSSYRDATQYPLGSTFVHVAWAPPLELGGMDLIAYNVFVSNSLASLKFVAPIRVIVSSLPTFSPPYPTAVFTGANPREQSSCVSSWTSSTRLPCLILSSISPLGAASLGLVKITGLQPNTMYFIAVSAVNAAGSSMLNSTLSVNFTTSLASAFISTPVAFRESATVSLISSFSSYPIVCGDNSFNSSIDFKDQLGRNGGGSIFFMWSPPVDTGGRRILAYALRYTFYGNQTSNVTVVIGSAGLCSLSDGILGYRLGGFNASSPVSISVTAFTSATQSPFSASVVYTSSRASLPSAIPTGSIVASLVSSDILGLISLYLRWSSPFDAGSEPILSYSVEVSMVLPLYVKTFEISADSARRGPNGNSTLGSFNRLTPIASFNGRFLSAVIDLSSFVHNSKIFVRIAATSASGRGPFSALLPFLSLNKKSGTVSLPTLSTLNACLPSSACYSEATLPSWQFSSMLVLDTAKLNSQDNTSVITSPFLAPFSAPYNSSPLTMPSSMDFFESGSLSWSINPQVTLSLTDNAASLSILESSPTVFINENVTDECVVSWRWAECSAISNFLPSVTQKCPSSVYLSRLTGFLVQIFSTTSGTSPPIRSIWLNSFLLLNETLGVNASIVATVRIAGLSAGGEYVAAVAACNIAGCGPYSAPTLFSTPVATSVELSPPDFFSLSQNLSSSSSSTCINSGSLAIKPGSGVISSTVVPYELCDNSTLTTGSSSCSYMIATLSSLRSTAPRPFELRTLLQPKDDTVPFLWPDTIHYNNSIYAQRWAAQEAPFLATEMSVGYFWGVASSWPQSRSQGILSGNRAALGKSRTVWSGEGGVQANSSVLLLSFSAGLASNTVFPKSVVSVSAPFITCRGSAPAAPVFPFLISSLSTQLNIGWEAPSLTGGRPIAAYVIQLACSQGTLNVTWTVCGGVSLLVPQPSLPSTLPSPLKPLPHNRLLQSWVFTNLAVESPYRVRVLAINEIAGTASTSSVSPSLISAIASAATTPYSITIPVNSVEGVGPFSLWSSTLSTAIATPPEPPSAGPTILSVLETTVELSWAEPAAESTGGLPLIGYVIVIEGTSTSPLATNSIALSALPLGTTRLSEALPTPILLQAAAAGIFSSVEDPPTANAGMSASAATNGNIFVNVGCVTTIVLAGLRPGTSYRFALLLKTMAGSSELSPFSLSITTLSSTHAPFAPGTPSCASPQLLRGLSQGLYPSSSALILFPLPAVLGDSGLSHFSVKITTVGRGNSSLGWLGNAIENAEEPQQLFTSGDGADSLVEPLSRVRLINVSALDAIYAGDIVIAGAASLGLSLPVFPNDPSGTFLGPTPFRVAWPGIRRLGALIVRHLSARTAYKIEVSAISASGIESPMSTSSKIFLMSEASPPAAPTLVDPIIASITSSTVDVRILLPADDGGEAITSYTVLTSTDGGSTFDMGSYVSVHAPIGVPVSSPTISQHCSLGAGIRGTPTLLTDQLSTSGPNSSGTNLGEIRSVPTVGGLLATNETLAQWTNGAVLLAINSDISDISLRSVAQYSKNGHGSSGDGSFCSKLSTQMRLVDPVSAATSLSFTSCVHVTVRMTGLIAGTSYSFSAIASNAAGFSSNSAVSNKVLASSSIVTNSSIRFSTSVSSVCPLSSLLRVSPLPAQSSLLFTPKLWSGYPSQSSIGSSLITTAPMTAPGPVDAVRVDWMSSPVAVNSTEAALRSLDANGYSTVSLSWLAPFDTGGMPVSCYRIEVAIDGLLASGGTATGFQGTDMSDIAMQVGGYSAAAGFITSIIPKPCDKLTQLPIFSGIEPTVGSWRTSTAQASLYYNESKDYSALPPWQPPPFPALQLSSERLKELSGISSQKSSILQAFDVLVGATSLNLPFSGVFNSTARLHDSNGVYNVIRTYALPTGSSCSPDPIFMSSSRSTRNQVRSDIIRASKNRVSYTLTRSLPASAVVRVRIIPLTTAVFAGVGFSSGGNLEGSAVNLLLFTPSTPPSAPASPVLSEVTSTSILVKFGATPLVSSGSCVTNGLQLYRAMFDVRTLSYSSDILIWSRFDAIDNPISNRTNSSILLNKLTTPIVPVSGGIDPPLLFNDIGLKRATSYRYRLSAYNCAGKSPFSSALLVSTLTTLSSAPLNITTLNTPDHVTVNLKWHQPLDDGGLAITSYLVLATRVPTGFHNLTEFEQITLLSNQSYWTGTSVTTFNLDVINPLQTTILLTLYPLLPGTLYAVRALAITSAGQGSSSIPILFSTAAPLKCPGLSDPIRGHCSGHGTCHSYLGTCSCDSGFSLPGCQFMNGVLFNASISFSSTAILDASQFQSTIALALSSNLSTASIDSSRFLVLNKTSNSVGRLLSGNAASSSTFSVLFLLQFTQKEAEYRFSSLIAALNASNNVPLLTAPPFPTSPLDMPPIVPTITLTRTLLLIAQGGSNALMSIGLISLSIILDASGSVPSPPSSVAVPLPDCSRQTDCNSCTQAHPTCGWCVTSATCTLGTLQGASPWTTKYDVSACTQPLSGVGVPSFWFTSASISSTRKCPAECSTLRSCSTCAARPDCGWCEQEQGCVRVVDVSRESACLGATESSRVAAQSQFKTFYPLVQTAINCPASRCRARPADFRCLSDPFCGLCVPSALELAQGATVRCAAGSSFDFHPDAGVSQCRSLDSLKTTGVDAGGPSGASYYFRPPPGTPICTSPNDSSCQTTSGIVGSCTFMPWEIASCSTCIAKPGCGFCASTGQCGRAGHVSALIEPTSPLEIALGTCSTTSSSSLNSFPASSTSSRWFSSNKISVSGSTTLVSVTLPNACPAKELTPRELCMSSSQSCLSCLNLAQTNGCVYCDNPRIAGITPSCMLLGTSTSTFSYATSLTQTCSSSNWLRGISFTGVVTASTNVFPKPVAYPYTIPNDGIDLSAEPRKAFLSLPSSARIGCPVTCVGQTLTYTAAKNTINFGSANSKEPLVPQNYGLTERGTCTWTLFPLQTNPNASYNANMLASSQFPSVEITFKEWDLAPGDSISIYDGPISRNSKPMVTLTGSTIRGTTSYLYSTSNDVSPIKYYYGQSTQGYVVVVLTIDTGGGQGFSFSYSGIPLSVVSNIPTERLILYIFVGGIVGTITILCCYCICIKKRRIAERRNEERRAQQLAQQRAQQAEQTPTFVIHSFPTFVFDKTTVHLTPILLDKVPEQIEKEKINTVNEIESSFAESPQEKLVRLRKEMSQSAEEISAPSCSVCLCSFDDGDDVKVLLCRHSFHRDCIDHALSIKVSCPMCRRSCVEMYTEMTTIANSGKENPLKFGNGVVMSKPSKSQQEEIDNRRRHPRNGRTNDTQDSDAVDVNEGDLLRTQTAQQMHAAQVLAMGRLRARALAAASGSNTGTGRIPRTPRISPLSSTEPQITTGDNTSVTIEDVSNSTMSNNPLFSPRTTTSSVGTGVGALVDVGGGRMVDLPAHLQAQLAEIEHQRIISELTAAQVRQQQRNAIEERLTLQAQRLSRAQVVDTPPLSPPPRQIVQVISNDSLPPPPRQSVIFPVPSLTVSGTITGSRSTVPESVNETHGNSASFDIGNPMYIQPVPTTNRQDDIERRHVSPVSPVSPFHAEQQPVTSSEGQTHARVVPVVSSLQAPIQRQEPIVITPQQILQAREEEAMETLVSMGFNPLLARRALRRVNGDANAAAEILFSSSEEEERPQRRVDGIFSRLSRLW